MALEDGKIEENEKFVERLDDEVDIQIGASSNNDKEKSSKDKNSRKKNFASMLDPTQLLPFKNSAKNVPHDSATISLLGRKTFTGGALNMGLVASNTDQLLTVVTSKTDLDGLDLAKIVLISFSLFVQIVMILTLTWIAILKPILTYPADSEKELKLERKYQLLNNVAVFLSCISTILNVMITSFNGHTMPQNKEIGITNM